MKEVLILLTHRFPDKKSEVFLWNEIKYQSFDESYVVSMVDGNDDITLDRRLCVIRGGKTLKHIGSIKWIAKAIVSLEMWREVFSLIKDSKLTKHTLRNVVLTSAYGERMINIIKRNIPKEPEKKYYLYAYWMTAVTYAAIKLKKNYFVNAITCSRCHGHDLYAYRYINDYIPYQKWFIENLCLICPISSNGKNYLLQRYGQTLDNKLFVSRLGTIDYGIQTGLQKDFTIISCSSIVRIKRIDRIIEVLRLINRETITWIHYGNGPEKEKLEKMISDSHFPPNISVRFAGHFDNDKLMNVYKNNHFDLFINVSETEGVPVSIMEAQSFGIPVVATNVGGVAELVDNSNGCLLKPDFTNEDLYKTILKFYYLDDEDMKSKRAASRERWMKLSNAESNYKEFYDRLKERELT